jgi:hypothetical protein
MGGAAVDGAPVENASERLISRRTSGINRS